MTIRRSTWLFAAVLMLGLGHLAWHLPYTMDDAFISFRYSANLAHGMGLVLNPGQYVKGYSNTLWTLLMTLPELLGASPLYLSKTLGMASFLGIAFCMKRLTGDAPFERSSTAPSGSVGVRPVHRAPREKDRIGDLPWQLLALGLLSLSAPIAVWCVAGMETGFFTVMVVGGVMLRLEEQRRGSRTPLSLLLFIGAIWTRPEGVIFFGAMALHDVIHRLVSRRIQLADIAWYILPLAAWVGELAWSQAYYGAPLPNTYYAKVRGGDDLFSLLGLSMHSVAQQLSAEGYFIKSISACGGYGVVGLGLFALADRRRFRRHSALLLMVLAQFAFICRVRGDWMPAARFLVPILPFLFILVAAGLRWLISLARPARRRLVAALASAAVLTLMLAGNLAISKDVAEIKPVDAQGLLQRGRYFTSLTGPGWSLAAYDIGGIGYASRLDILDTWGVADEFIARRRYADLPASARYLTLLQPDLIRRHSSRRKNTDEALYRSAMASERYVAFANQRGMIRSQVLFQSELPADASPPLDIVSSKGADYPRIAGFRLPPAAAAGQRVEGVLFWIARGEGAEPIVDRTIALVAESGVKIPASSNRIAETLGDARIWPTQSYYRDYFTFEAPSQFGVFDVVVQHDGNTLPVATIEVVGTEPLSRYGAMLLDESLGLADRGALRAALERARMAFQLDATSAKDRYVELACGLAHEHLGQASSGQPFADMMHINAAKFILNRAYYDLLWAPRELREAVDDVEARRASIIEEVFPDFRHRASPRRG